MGRFTRLLVILATIILGKSAGAQAQDISIELMTKDGRSEYRIGEPIPLQLVFTSFSKLYIVDSSFRYPEIGEPKDDFQIEPKAGWSDPLEDYRRALRSSRLAGFVMGGIRGLNRPAEHPVTLDFLLGRYVRFDEPGRYTLMVADRRASLIGKGFGEAPEILELTTKPLVLKIVAADAKWQQQQLSSARESLKKNAPGTNVGACEALQALGTPAAEIVLADQLDGSPGEPSCGSSSDMLGARNRGLLLEHMAEVLKRPDGSVGPNLMSAMAELKALEDGGGEYYERQTAALEEISGQLFASLGEKKGPARNSAISTLVNASLMVPENASGEWRKQIFKLAATEFEELTPQAQSTLLSARWKDVASPALVPVLKRCAEGETKQPCGQWAGELLLARLQELSPGDAREVVLADMQSENPRFPANVLAMLPDKELPEMDSVFRERLQSKDGNLDQAAALIERYATGAIAGDVASFLQKQERGKFGGEIETNLIAYLLRVEPEAGAQVLRSAMRARDNDGYKYVLRAVSQKMPAPEIQNVAMEALSDPVYEVQQSAVQALAVAGGEKAKGALFERLEEWRSRWAGREREIERSPEQEFVDDERHLGDELIMAIGRGAGWLLSTDDQQRFERSTLTEYQKTMVTQIVDQARTRPVQIRVIAYAPPHIQIIAAQYSFEDLEKMKSKLSQFPVGTSFIVGDQQPESDEARRAGSEISTFLRQHGMLVQADAAH